MKKVKLFTIIAIIYIGLILINTNVYAANTGKVINNSTRIREKATTSSETVTVVSAGEKVEIISEEGEWYKVKYTKNKISYDGYIRKDMINVSSKTKTVKKENTKNDETEKEETTNSEENVESEDKIEVKEGIKFKVSEDVETRVFPLINSSTSEKITKNTEVSIIEIIGKWSYIESNEKNGWVITSKLENVITEKTENIVKEQKKEEAKEEEKKDEKVDGKTLYITTETVNLRKEASTDSSIIEQLSKNDKVTLIDSVHSTWTKVKYKNLTGYIASEYLSEKKVQVTSRSSDEARKEKEEEEKKKQEEEKKKAEEEKKKQEEAKKKAEEEKKKQEEAKKKAEEEKKKQEETKTKSKSGVTGSDIVAYAKKFLGCKYVYGASGPDKFDCSGFTSYVYKHFGYSLSRTSSGQRSNGKKVKKSDLKPGDIVCFSGHVGIYIGGNEFIHAANPSKGVIITSLSSSYYVKTYITARRIIN